MNEVNASESRLKAEIDDLKRQLEEQKRLGHGGVNHNRRPSALSLVLIGLLLVALVVVGFFAGACCARLSGVAPSC